MNSKQCGEEAGCAKRRLSANLVAERHCNVQGLMKLDGLLLSPRSLEYPLLEDAKFIAIAPGK